MMAKVKVASMRFRMVSIFRAGVVAVMVTGFALFLTLWIHSRSVGDVLFLGRGTTVVEWHGRWQRTYRLESEDGRLALVQDNTSYAEGGGLGVRWVSGVVPSRWLLQSMLGGNPARRWQLLGFEWAEYRGIPPLSSYAPRNPADQLVLGRRWVIPYWAVVIPAGIGIIMWVRRAILRHRERRRLLAGLCIRCGYDLRASKERCPECGAAITGEGPAERSGKKLGKVKVAAMCVGAAGILTVGMVVASMLAVSTSGIAVAKPATSAPVEAAAKKPAASAPADIEETETAWGKAVDGLQVGLLVEDGKRSWRIGESFTVAFVVRNVSEERVELSYAVAGRLGELSAPYGLLVRDSDGQFGYYHLPSNRGAMIPHTSLAPGQSQILRSSKMTIWPIGLDRTPEPGTLMVEPGKYSLSQVDVQMDAGFWVGVGMRSTAGLTTGTVELEILPARPDDPLLKAVSTQPVRSYSTADIKAVLSVMGHYMQMNLDVLPMGMGNKDAWNSERRAVEKDCAMLSDGAVDFLGHLATTRSDELSRRLASQLLGSCGKDRAGFLLQALSDESADVRCAAARAIWDFRTPEVIERLLQMLKKDEVARVRSSAAMALGHIGDHGVTADLIEALKSDKDAGVQRDIVIALLWLKDKDAIPALEELRKSRSDADFQLWMTRVIRDIENPKAEGTVGQPASRSVNEAAATRPAAKAGPSDAN